MTTDGQGTTSSTAEKKKVNESRVEDESPESSRIMDGRSRGAERQGRKGLRKTSTMLPALAYGARPRRVG